MKTADNVGALRAILKREGSFLTSVKETRASASSSSGAGTGINFDALLDKVSSGDIMLMTQQLGSELRNRTRDPPSS